MDKALIKLRVHKFDIRNQETYLDREQHHTKLPNMRIIRNIVQTLSLLNQSRGKIILSRFQGKGIDKTTSNI